MKSPPAKIDEKGEAKKSDVEGPTRKRTLSDSSSSWHDDEAIATAKYATHDSSGVQTTHKPRVQVIVPTKNVLSKVRPGYIAPMQLAAPSLDKFKCDGGLESFRKAAMKQDYKAALVKSSLRMQNGHGSHRTPGFKAQQLKQQGMLDPSSDPTLAQDLHLIRHRNYLDPKRFYKNPDIPGKWVQRGTYIEDGRKVRNGSLVDQVLGAQQESVYVKRKFQTMQRVKQEKASKRHIRKHKR